MVLLRRASLLNIIQSPCYYSIRNSERIPEIPTIRTTRRPLLKSSETWSMWRFRVVLCISDAVHALIQPSRKTSASEMVNIAWALPLNVSKLTLHGYHQAWEMIRLQVHCAPRQNEKEDHQRTGHDNSDSKTKNVLLFGMERSQGRLIQGYYCARSQAAFVSPGSDLIEFPVPCQCQRS